MGILVTRCKIARKPTYTREIPCMDWLCIGCGLGAGRVSGMALQTVSSSNPSSYTRAIHIARGSPGVVVVGGCMSCLVLR